AINVHARVNEHAGRAKPPGGGTGHRRTAAELPRLVAGAATPAPPTRWSADNHRFSAQIGVVPLLDSGIESIHIKMENGARHRVSTNLPLFPLVERGVRSSAFKRSAVGCFRCCLPKKICYKKRYIALYSFRNLSKDKTG